MYHVLDEPKGKDWLDSWAKVTGDFDQVKSYMNLGEVFVINSKTNEIGILFPMSNSFEPMGFTSWEEFDTVVLQKPKFQEDVANKSFTEQVRAHCGELEENQVYIAKPYPFLGGSGAPETYKKGDVWVFYQFRPRLGSKFNNVRHGEVYYIAASSPFRSRAC